MHQWVSVWNLWRLPSAARLLSAHTVTDLSTRTVSYTHLAFRVATNLRLAVSEHLARLPLGFTERYGSGKFRKVIQESTGAAETYLAHQLPEQYAAMATPCLLYTSRCLQGRSADS